MGNGRGVGEAPLAARHACCTPSAERTGPTLPMEFFMMLHRLALLLGLKGMDVRLTTSSSCADEVETTALELSAGSADSADSAVGSGLE